MNALAAAPGEEGPYVAVGVLSSAIQFETNRASTSKLRLLRTRWRESASRFSNLNGGIVFRFVLSPPPQTSNAERRAKYARDFEAAQAEAAQHSDMVFVNMTELFYLCAWKKILWYRYATATFPTARFIMVADSDTYVQLEHLEADLRNTQALIDAGEATEFVHYGLVLWKPFVNRLTLEPAPAQFHAGWGFADRAAASLRARLEDCHASRVASGAAKAAGAGAAGGGHCQSRRCEKECGGTACAAICGQWRSRELTHVDSMHAAPPYMFTAGPLFGLSRSLARLIAADSGPAAWREEMEQTEVVKWYLKRQRVPIALRQAACYPASFDAVHGWWVRGVAERRRINVTMVNTPFQIQHHPWLAFRHGAFSNASIVLHELKNPQSPGWTFAPMRGSGPFVPYARTCGACEAMGWSTIPGNPMGRWRCCGAPVTRRELLQACRDRAHCVALPGSGRRGA